MKGSSGSGFRGEGRDTEALLQVIKSRRCVDCSDCSGQRALFMEGLCTTEASN